LTYSAKVLPFIIPPEACKISAAVMALKRKKRKSFTAVVFGCFKSQTC